MSLLMKQLPAISHLALYDIVNTPGIIGQNITQVFKLIVINLTNKNIEKRTPINPAFFVLKLIGDLFDRLSIF